MEIEVVKMESGLLVATTPPPPDYIPTDEPQWDVFMGNNHVRIALSGRMGGHFSCERWLGMTLEETTKNVGPWDGLWRDLIWRLQVSGMCIYKHNMGQWTVGWGPGKCIIELDEQERISDIHIYPYGRPKE
jgi:hypothetical protein